VTRTFTADLSKAARRAHRTRQQEVLNRNRTLSKRTFGVEIEYVGTPTKLVVAEAIEQVVGEHVHVTGYHSPHCYRCNQVVRYDKWKVCHDGSLHGRGDGLQSTTGEVVSPVLKGEAGLDTLKKVLAAMRSVGCKTNVRCGLHVHIGVQDITVNGLQRLAHNYETVQSEIYSWMPSRRVTGTYSKPWLPSWSGSLAQGLKAFKEGQRHCSLGDKYRGLNLLPIMKIGTVEFRHHQGSVDTNLIAPWVRFCLGFVDSQVDDESLIDRTIPENQSVLTYLVEGKYLPPKSAEKIAERVGRWN
jgi:hypothetical protein